MSVRFDGSTDALSRTTNLPSITSFTMMGWFYFSADRNTIVNTLAFGQSSGGGYYQLYWDQTGSGSVLGTWNGAASSSGTTSLSLSTWYHLAMTVSGTAAGNFLVYLNGALEITAAGRDIPTAGKLWVGNDNDSEWLNGRVAAVKIYDAVLTAAEIAQEMRQIQPVRFANLNSWYPLWSTADDEIDYSGQGRTLTVGGTLAMEDGPPIPWKQGRRRLVLPAVASPPGDSIVFNAGWALNTNQYIGISRAI